MDELKQLVNIVKQNAKSTSLALLNYNDSTNLEIKLFNLISNAELKDESELIDLLYGSEDKSSGYKMLKSRVKKKLYNQLNFLDFENRKKFTKRQAAEIKCNALLNEALILSCIQDHQLMDKLLLQVIKIAKEAEITSHVLRALDLQRLIYSFNILERKKFYIIQKEYEKYTELFLKETEAKNLYFQVLFESRLGVNNRNKKKQLLTDSVKRLKELWDETGSSFIFHKYENVKTTTLEAFANTEDYIEHLKETIDLYYQGKINHYNFSPLKNQYNLVYAYLKSKRFEEGIEQAELLKHLLDKNSSNWFAHMENYFLLYMHSNNLIEAKKVLDEVYNNKAFQNNTKFAQERWHLFYEFYILITKDITNRKKNIEFKYVSQDKNGYNVWYLIQRYLKIIKEGDADQILWHTDRLRKYFKSHLGPGSDKRTALFFKLMFIVGQNFANPTLCRKKGHYLYNKLLQTPTAGDAYAETEIVPYEHLWEFILKTLLNEFSGVAVSQNNN